MDANQIARERRLQRRLEALETNDPRCLHCGESDPFCLEPHEPGGKEFCEESVIECRNCHRKLEDARKDHPPQLSNPPMDEERIAHALRGLADALRLIAAFVDKYSERILDKVRAATSAGAGGAS